jgi:hypothetical protein
MKKKIVDNIKIIIIILIAVTILFAILGAFNISTKESMYNPETPQCFPDIVTDDQTDGYAGYQSEIDTDRYILKTKIVPPKGTACPSKISGAASEYLNGISDAVPGSASIESSNNNSSIQAESTNSSMSITDTRTPEKAVAPEETVPEPANSNTNHTEVLNEIKGSISQINQQKTKPDSCPPCPACERCPEPAFECKKVPNYRSPSIGQYMPMPILNDFSSF